MYHLLCARHSFKHFICINLFNLPVTHETGTIIIPILQMNQSSRKLSNITKGTLPPRGKVGIQTQEIRF